jgi:transcription elongation factor GreA
MDEIVITPEGRERLDAELERLVTDGRREIAERLKQAAAGEANRAESAEYLSVREEQALLERRIALLAERLQGAQVIEPQLGNGRVDVGERVRVRDLESGARLELELVGTLESDAGAGRVSVASPVGRAILGLRRGEIAEVDTPRGKRQFKVLAVEPTDATGDGRRRGTNVSAVRSVA